MAVRSAVIYGTSGLSLTDAERSFFREVDPYGYILFARNCETPEQVKALVSDLQELSGDPNIPVLIDQEGGRVARLKPPHWRGGPAAGELASICCRDEQEGREAIYLHGRLTAMELIAQGINVDCAPVVDLIFEGAHSIIGDRAYGSDPEHVAILAREMAKGLSDGGVVPIMKHIPGHGRATADSHEALPVVDTPLEELEKTDFLAFKLLKDLPMAMTAHVVYTALDKKNMATISPTVIEYIRNKIGFKGLLMSDDLSMHAMTGSYESRTTAVLDAGCDIVLHCNGDMEEMTAIAKTIRPMTKEAVKRSEQAFASVGQKDDTFSFASAKERLDGLLRMAA